MGENKTFSDNRFHILILSIQLQQYINLLKINPFSLKKKYAIRGEDNNPANKLNPAKYKAKFPNKKTIINDKKDNKTFKTAVSQSVFNKEKNSITQKKAFSKIIDLFFSKKNRAGQKKTDNIRAMGVRSFPVERLRKLSNGVP